MTDFPWLYLVAWIASVAIIIWRYERTLKSIRSQLIDARHRADFIEEELAACRNKLTTDQKDADVSAQNVDLTEFTDVFERISSSEPLKDDLKIVEGIGPKIEKIFHGSSIYTFADLSVKTVEELRILLEQAGSRYAMHDPTTWPKQAKMAMDGRWDELKKWQSELDKGRIV